MTTNPESVNKIAGFIRLLTHHRGEAAGSYDEVAGGYDFFVSFWDHYVAAAAMKEYERLLAERVPAGGVVLDAGAGTGERTLAILRAADPGRVVALDASAGMLDVAKSKIDDTRVEFQLGDVARLPFPDDTFDVVSSSWTIEILDDPKAAVTEFLRVLKPGGTVLYSFCSLPQGSVGRVARWIADHVLPGSNPLSHLLDDEQAPFHDCSMSSLQRFSGGLTTVATLGKCCSVAAPGLPCTLRVSSDANLSAP